MLWSWLTTHLKQFEVIYSRRLALDNPIWFLYNSYILKNKIFEAIEQLAEVQHEIAMGID